MNESPWTRKICQEMRKCNAMVFSVVGGQMQMPGWPDRYICHRYWQGWLEFKGVQTRVSSIQRVVLRGLRKHHPGLAYVVRMPDRIEDEEGQLVRRFDGTGKGLLTVLERLTCGIQDSS